MSMCPYGNAAPLWKNGMLLPYGNAVPQWNCSNVDSHWDFFFFFYRSTI